MKFKIATIFSILTLISVGTAHANWQYPGSYLGDGVYNDDGSRFTMSLRMGGAIGSGAIINEIGSMTAEYYVNPNNGAVVSAEYYDAHMSELPDFQYAGLGDLSKLSATKDLSSFGFAGGVSIGWTIPNSPQWRLELGWDHVSETEYDSMALFDGDLELSGGDLTGVVLNIQSGAAQSTITTDIFSVIAFYDFFDGGRKPLNTFIPYVGLGMGYADSTTVLNLSDLYGDLSSSVDLQNFGTVDEFGVLQFNKSTKTNSNIAGLLALGFSYGLTENMFFDIGARITYIPKIKWQLTSTDAEKTRDWFSAENVIYTNIMMGIRLEF